MYVSEWKRKLILIMLQYECITKMEPLQIVRVAAQHSSYHHEVTFQLSVEVMQEIRVFEHVLDGVEQVDDLSCLDTPFDGTDTQANLPQVSLFNLLQILKFTQMQILTLKMFVIFILLSVKITFVKQSYQHLVYITANVP